MAYLLGSVPPLSSRPGCRRVGPVATSRPAPGAERRRPFSLPRPMPRPSARTYSERDERRRVHRHGAADLGPAARGRLPRDRRRGAPQWLGGGQPERRPELVLGRPHHARGGAARRTPPLPAHRPGPHAPGAGPARGDAEHRGRVDRRLHGRVLHRRGHRLPEAGAGGRGRDGRRHRDRPAAAAGGPERRRCPGDRHHLHRGRRARRRASASDASGSRPRWSPRANGPPAARRTSGCASPGSCTTSSGTRWG